MLRRTWCRVDTRQLQPGCAEARVRRELHRPACIHCHFAVRVNGPAACCWWHRRWPRGATGPPSSPADELMSSCAARHDPAAARRGQLLASATGNHSCNANRQLWQQPPASPLGPVGPVCAGPVTGQGVDESDCWQAAELWWWGVLEPEMEIATDQNCVLCVWSSNRCSHMWHGVARPLCACRCGPMGP